MNRQEYLLVKLAEECGEVQHRVAKLLQFGPSQCEPGQLHSNVQRLRDEVNDVLAMVDLLEDEAVLPTLTADARRRWVEAKRRKVSKYFHYSVQLGCVTNAGAEVAPCAKTPARAGPSASLRR
jgi:NTP pyrophosphatase (non-canonical NTP hydrolase)